MFHKHIFFWIERIVNGLFMVQPKPRTCTMMIDPRTCPRTGTPSDRFNCGNYYIIYRYPSDFTHFFPWDNRVNCFSVEPMFHTTPQGVGAISNNDKDIHSSGCVEKRCGNRWETWFSSVADPSCCPDCSKAPCLQAIEIIAGRHCASIPPYRIGTCCLVFRNQCGQSLAIKITDG
jgi:hypothetical protein